MGIVVQISRRDYMGHRGVICGSFNALRIDASIEVHTCVVCYIAKNVRIDSMHAFRVHFFYDP